MHVFRLLGGLSICLSTYYVPGTVMAVINNNNSNNINFNICEAATICQTHILGNSIKTTIITTLIIWLTFTEHLLCAWCCSKNFAAKMTL